MCLCVYVCMCVCVYVCMYVCVCVGTQGMQITSTSILYVSWHVHVLCNFKGVVHRCRLVYGVWYVVCVCGIDVVCVVCGVCGTV